MRDVRNVETKWEGREKSSILLTPFLFLLILPPCSPKPVSEWPITLPSYGCIYCLGNSKGNKGEILE